MTINLLMCILHHCLSIYAKITFFAKNAECHCKVSFLPGRCRNQPRRSSLNVLNRHTISSLYSIKSSIPRQLHTVGEYFLLQTCTHDLRSKRRKNELQCRINRFTYFTSKVTGCLVSLDKVYFEMGVYLSFIVRYAPFVCFEYLDSGL